MTTRRHRIVIKPNIRPAAAKPVPTNTPKPKISSNAASECPSPAIRPQLVSLSHDETPLLSANEVNGGDTVFDTDISTHASKSAADLPENNAEPVLEGAGFEQKVSTVTTETNSEAQNQVESAHTRKEKALADVQGIINDDVSVKGYSNLSAKSGPNTGTPSIHPRKSPKSVNLETANQAIKQKDINDSEEVIKDVDDDDRVTPSEADGSCMSDVMSLDPDNERREEVGDKTHKKNRRHKSKKLRAEPLPSREKSPDRQKMKMSDLLCWNPQQNFFPRKNKKKSPLKNENRPLSPTLSVTSVEDDKDSSNQSASLPAPQVMIGPDGSVILNTESLMIQTQKDDRPKEVLEDNDEDRYLNTNSYRKYKKAKLWTERETEKFFVGLSMCGTDFSLLTNLLTHRSRRELKNKFHREERRNRELIDKALSKRQQYDLSPFKKMAVEDDKKIKKTTKKQMKKEALKDEKVTRKRGKKRKNESADEEGDWVPEYDEEDEENKNVGSDKLADTLAVKHKSKVAKVKRETDYQNKPKQVDQNLPAVVPEDTSKPFLPGYPTGSVPSVQDDLPTEYTDLDDPRMRSKPAKTYSKLNSQIREGQQQTSPSPSASTGTNFTSSINVIQAIPGSTQVQIEMEGVQNPVQGVLIPSHMVPQVAPQLGIYGSASGMQVLLVQEETESGSLVHVYVIPESDTARGSGDNVDVGLSGPGSHLSFSSPIPSPHPTTAIQSPHPATSIQSPHPTTAIQSPHPPTSIQSPHTISPFSAACSPHPLSSVCSPQPNPTFHSSPSLFNVTPEDHVQRQHPQSYTPLQQQSLYPQSLARPSSDISLSNQEHQDTVVIMPPPTGNYPILRQSQNASAIKHNSSSSCEQIVSDFTHNHRTQTITDTIYTALQPPSVNTALLPHNTSLAVSLQTPNILQHSRSETLVTSDTHIYNSDVILVVEDDQTIQAGDGEAYDTPYNSNNVIMVASEVIENDCIMLNSDKPQSRVDMSL